MSDSISTVMFTFRRSMNKLLPLRFQFNAHTHQVLIQANLPNGNINFLGQRLNNIAIQAGGNRCVTRQLCHVLQQVFGTIPPANNNNGQFNENLAIMFIDGALHLGDNFSAASNEFNRCGITLVVVSVATPTFEVWDYYSTLADYTGGEYMLIENASYRLAQVILSAISGEGTLRQAFRCMRIANLPVVPSNIGDTNEQQQETDGVGELDFDHDLS